MEHCSAMADAGELADNAWEEHGRFIAGDDGFSAVRALSIGTAHPPFPIFSYFLGVLPMVSNGATVQLWSKPDPLCLCILNVNHSQTRKSRLTALAESVACLIDEECGKGLMSIWDAKHKVATKMREAKRRRVDRGEDGNRDEGGEASMDPPLPFPGAKSVGFLGGTIESCRERCSGDSTMVRQVKAVQCLPALSARDIGEDCPGLSSAERAMGVLSGMQGRTWFGSGLLFDEAYQFLQDIAILDKPCEKRSSDGPGSGQTPLAGWFNRLCQSGKSDHETKSCGSHGGLSVQPVALSFLGNFHPTPAIEMIRGERGDHGCQAKARLMLVTGSPVQPHEEYEDCDGVQRKQTWVTVPDVLLDPMGLGKQCRTIAEFEEFYKSPRAEEVAQGGEEQDPMPWDQEAMEGEEDLAATPPRRPDFVPDGGRGFPHVLPDGVTVPVRMAWSQAVNKFVVQWCLPDRLVAIPDHLDIMKKFPQLIVWCKQVPHRNILLSDEARGTFLSYQTHFNVKVKVARDANDVNLGAEYGAAPWKLGMLAACLLMWDVLWEARIYRFAEEQWTVDPQHIHRAFRLLCILDDIRESFRHLEAPKPTGGEPGHATVDPDRNLAGAAAVANATTTEICRRMMCAATPVDGADGGDPTFRSHAMGCYRIWTKKEMDSRNVGKVSAIRFREFARLVPVVIGKFDPDQDSLIFKLPTEPDASFETALRGYANITADDLRRLLERERNRGGRRKPRASQ